MDPGDLAGMLACACNFFDKATRHIAEGCMQQQDVPSMHILDICHPADMDEVGLEEVGAHSDEAQGGRVGDGGALNAIDDEEAARRAGERTRVDKVVQQLAGSPHRLEQRRPHRRIRLARYAHHYVAELRRGQQCCTIFITIAYARFSCQDAR